MTRHLLLALVLVASLSDVSLASGGAAYDYDHQDKWGGVCISGRRQSPVDIRTGDLYTSRSTRSLIFNWRKGTTLSGVFENKAGHTVQFTPAKGSPVITTQTFRGIFTFQQMHMHWGENNGVGSEHRINGEQASLELHFVHRNLWRVATARDAYAVVSVMADAGSENANSPFNKLPVKAVQNINSHTNAQVSLYDFLPADRSYYFYEGSLTTPLCSEVVQWFVMKERITVPRSFMASLRKVKKNSAGATIQYNYRDPQSLLCRPVYEHQCNVCRRTE